jgi:alkylation response protein AidB-like acyl-CoA dehydrogenase
MAKETTALKRGGAFLIEESAAQDIFTPEDFSEEQMMIRNMTERFVEDEVLPQIERIEHKEWDVTVGLLKRCGELGLLGIEVPEQYGGENLTRSLP